MVDSAGTLKLPRGMGGFHGTGYKPHSDGCGIRARLMMGWFGLSHCGGADQGQGARSLQSARVGPGAAAAHDLDASGGER